MEYLSRSLDKVLSAAQKLHVKVALENRMYYEEIPHIAEVVQLLSRFSGAPLFYWHDTGHAEVNVRLGLVENHETYLKTLAPSMAGMHLHDLRKLDDHYAPGTGDFDFRVLLPFVSEQTIKVVEAHPKSSEKDVKKTQGYLQKIGLIQ